MPLHSNVYRKRGEPTNVGCEVENLANREGLSFKEYGNPVHL